MEAKAKPFHQVARPPDGQACGSAHLLHGFVQRRPFLIEAFILDLPQLDIRDVVFLGHDLVGSTHGHPQILGCNQVSKNIATLLQRQTFGRHALPLPFQGLLSPGRANLDPSPFTTTHSAAMPSSGSRPTGTAQSPLSRTPLRRRARDATAGERIKRAEVRAGGKPFHRERSSPSLPALYVSQPIAEAKFRNFLPAFLTPNRAFRKSNASSTTFPFGLATSVPSSLSRSASRVNCCVVSIQ